MVGNIKLWQEDIEQRFGIEGLNREVEIAVRIPFFRVVFVFAAMFFSLWQQVGYVSISDIQ